MPRIDDTSSEIVYSTGQWQTSQGDSRQYQGTSHFTTVVNAEATIDFRGTRIRVYGTNPGSGGTIEAFFTLDNVEILWRKTSDGRAQDMFWESPTLTNSPHTLIVRNSGGSQVPFHLDFFDIEVPGSPATEPPNTPDTPNTPNEPTPPLPLNSPVSTPRADPSRTDLPTVNPPAQTPSTGQDSPDLPIISQAPTNDRDSSNNSNGGSITVTEVSTQVKPVPIFETNESSKGNISGTKGGLETGAIVGITIGALALILLLGIFVLLLKRRRKRLDKEARGSSDLVYQAGPEPFDVGIPQAGGLVHERKTLIMAQASAGVGAPVRNSVLSGNTGSTNSDVNVGRLYTSEKSSGLTTNGLHSRMSSEQLSYVTDAPPAYTPSRDDTIIESREGDVTRP